MMMEEETETTEQLIRRNEQAMKARYEQTRVVRLQEVAPNSQFYVPVISSVSPLSVKFKSNVGCYLNPDQVEVVESWLNGIFKQSS